MEEFIALLPKDLFFGEPQLVHDRLIDPLDNIVTAVKIHHIRHGIEDVLKLLFSHGHLFKKPGTFYRRGNLIRKTDQELHVLLGDLFPVEIIIDPDKSDGLVARDERYDCVCLGAELLYEQRVGQRFTPDVLDVTGDFFTTARVSTVSSVRGISMPTARRSRNDSSRFGEFTNILHDIVQGLSFEGQVVHILHASSGVAGPTPITPFRVFLSSLTRKRIARLNPIPSLMVTAVRTILSSLLSSSVLLMAELMKKSRDIS